MAKGHLSEGQDLWWPAGSAEDSSFHLNNGHLHLVFKEEEEEEDKSNIWSAVLYTTETWRINLKLRDQFTGFKGICLHRILKIHQEQSWKSQQMHKYLQHHKEGETEKLEMAGQCLTDEQDRTSIHYTEMGTTGEKEFAVVFCSTSKQHTSVPLGRICSDKYTCCYTETEVADQTCYLTQSQHTDTRPTSPSADPIILGAWQGSHWSANF